MRRFLSLVLAVVMVASVAVVSFSATGSNVATVTINGFNGGSVTKTYAVGDTITAYSYLNTKEICDAAKVEAGDDFGIGSLDGKQTYTNSVLELADAYEPTEGDIEDVDSMFPVIKDFVVANGKWTVSEDDPALGEVYYNASKPQHAGFKFNSDDTALIITHYTVKAGGEAVINNHFETLAVSDRTLTRIVAYGVIEKDNFTTPVALSDPTIPVASGSTVSGSITSYLNDSFPEAKVTVTLTGTDNNFTASGDAFTTEYSFADVPAGSYKLSVAKDYHVTREYEITVSEDTTQDVVINPTGDIDGDGVVSGTDAMLAYRCARGKTSFEGYVFDCADVDGDKQISATDTMLIYRQARGKQSLFPA